MVIQINSLVLPCVSIEITGLELTEILGNSKEWPGTARLCLPIQRNGLVLQGSAWQFKGKDWHWKEVHGNLSDCPGTARPCVNSKECPGTARQCLAIQSNGLSLQHSDLKFKGMAWNCKAVLGISKEWPGTERRCMEIQKKSLALEGRMSWHFKAVEIERNGLELHNSKKWPCTERQCMEIEMNGLALQGLMWQFKGLAWNHKEVFGSSKEWTVTVCSAWKHKGMAWHFQEVLFNYNKCPGTSIQCVKIQSNGLALQGSALQLKELASSESKFKGIAWLQAFNTPDYPEDFIIFHIILIIDKSYNIISEMNAMCQFKGMSWHCKAAEIKRNGLELHIHVPHVAIQRPGVESQGSVWQFKRMNCHCEKCMEIHRNGLALPGMCENSKGWPGNARQSVTIQRNSLALQGSSWDFKGLAGPVSHVGDFNEYHGTARDFLGIQRNAMSLKGSAQPFKGMACIAWTFKVLAWN
ncbi:hypothetical protein VP01_2144g3 [Puccinia sorghi]|uniref:Uncharacterized protein n=1 Tax=Puccinia sorghi TaxID=27349 RepID=A0A0L6VAC5_9BASI|nr:hypothetical protein VP01_2144g3 [Puccinia sorghi]